MVERLKTDIRFYQQQSLVKRKAYEKYQFHLKTMKTQYEKLRTETVNADSLLQKLKDNITAEEQERINHIEDLKRLILEKEIQEKNEKMRL